MQPIVFTSLRDDVGGDTNGDGGATSPSPGNWARLQVNGTATISHAQIRYGGFFYGSMVQSVGGDLTLLDSIISDSASDGVRVSGSDPTLSNNVYRNNTSAAISMDLNSNPTISGVTVSDNAINGLQVDAGTLEKSLTWDDPDIVYWLNDDVTVPSGTTLQIDAGQVVKPSQGNAELIVDGTLDINGTAADPVVFTSAWDDTRGGDTNNDNGANGPVAGHWARIRMMDNSSGNTIDHLQSHYGGFFYGGMVFADDAPLSVTNSLLGMSASTAIVSVNGATVDVGNNIIAGNVGTGIFAGSGAQVTAVNNTIDGNARGVLSRDAASSVELTNNLITFHSTVGVASESGGGVTARFNDVFNPASSNFSGLTDPTGADGNTSVDPKYFNAGNGQYFLTSGSPAIDSADGDVAPASDHVGNPRFDDPNVINVGSGSIPFVDRGALERQEVSTSSTDLATTSVTAAAAGIQDDIVTVNWTVESVGSDPAVGSWHDGVYLSVDTVWTPDDILLAEFEHTGSVGPGQSYSASGDVTLPGVLPGDYYFIVRADTRNEMFEALREPNNSRPSDDVITIDLPSLPFGAPVQSQLAAAGQTKFFKVTTPAGADLTVDLTGPFNAINELFISHASLPSRQSFDARGIRPDSADQTVSVGSTRVGEYIVMARGAAVPTSGETFTLTATLAGFGIQSISPVQGANIGQVTIKLNGAQFRGDTDVQLIDSAGGVISQTATYLTDSGRLAATFDLSGAPTGLADVRVINPGNVVTELPDAFNIVEGVAGRLAMDLSAPSRVRAGRSFILDIHYQNDGDTDLISPLFELVSTGANEISLYDDFRTTFAAGEPLNLLATAEDFPAGILPPDASGTIRLFVNATAISVNEFQVNFADFPNSPIDWNSLGTAIQPVGFDETQWDDIVGQLELNIGTQWDDLQVAFSEAANLLPPSLGLSYSQADAFAIHVNQAIAGPTTSVTGRLFLSNQATPFGNASIGLLNTATGDLFSAVTLNDGTFVVHSMDAGTYDVVIDGFVSQSPLQLVVPAGGLQDESITIERAASISGSVVHSSGFPVRNVPVSVIAEDGSIWSALTDGNGLFSIGSLTAGEYEVVSGGGSFTRSDEVAIELSPSEQARNVVLIRSDGATVSGEVTDQNGLPVEGVFVSAQNDDGDGFGELTDASGQFTIDALPAGTFDVSAHTNGVTRVVVSDVVVPPSGTISGLDLQFGPSGTLAGTVVRLDDSSPVDLAVVNVLINDESYLAQTDSLGAFEIDGLSPGSYTVRLESDTFQTASFTAVVIADNTTTVPISLSERGVVTGTVTDSGGAPVAGVVVYAADDSGLVESAVTDTSGEYTLATLDTGDLQIILGDEGTPGADGQSVSVSASDTDFDIDFQMNVAAIISGEVSAADGTTPIDSAFVTAFLSGQPLITRPVEDDGSYSLVLMQAGNYRLEATATELAFPVIATVNASGGGLIGGQDFMAGSETISGVVTDADSGQPIDEAVVQIAASDTQLSEGRPVGRIITGAGGTFSLDSLVPGDYSVLILADGFAAQRQSVSISAGTAVDASAALSVGGALSGTIWDDQSGLPLSGATVVLTSRTDPSITATAVTDQSGSYGFISLPPGTFFVTVVADDFDSIVTNDFNITAANAARDWALTPADSLASGTVRDGARALGQVLVTATDAMGNIRGQALTENDGTFVIDSLPPGQFLVSAAAPGAIDAAAQLVTVNDASITSGIDFQIDVIAISDPPANASVSAEGEIIPDWIKRAFGFPGQRSDHVSRTDSRVSDLFAARKPNCQNIGSALLASIDAQDSAFRSWKGVASTMGNFGNTGRLVSEIGGLGKSILKLVIHEASNIVVNGLLQIPGNIVNQFRSLRDGVVSVAGTIKQLSSRVAAGDLQGALDLLNSPSGPTIGERLENSLNNIKKNIDEIRKNARSLPETFAAVRDSEVMQRFFDVLDTLGAATVNVLGIVVGVRSELMRFVEVQNAEETYNKAVERANFRLKQMERCVIHGEVTIVPAFQPGRNQGPSRTVDGVGGFDPNDKTAAAGYGSESFIQSGPIPFLVQFENDPDLGATVAAQEVFVSDILDDDLDLSKLEFTGFGFNNMQFDVPPGLSHYEVTLDLRPDDIKLLVEVILDVDPETRTLTASFRSLDPLTLKLPDDVDAGFLPVNDKAIHNGEGFFTYSIATNNGLSTGTEITNQASIVFDVNDPILTPTAMNTIDDGAPSSSVAALPEAFGTSSFMIELSGQDDAGGSGVAAHDIYVSRDNGPFELAAARITDTEYEFTGGVSGSTYGFVSIAHDNVGNVEPMPTVADTETLVIIGAWVNRDNVYDVNAKDGVTPGDALRVINELFRKVVFDPTTSVLTPLPPAGYAPPYLDVTDDGKLTALDALRVINFLFHQSVGGNPEAELSSITLDFGESNQGNDSESTSLIDPSEYIGVTNKVDDPVLQTIDHSSVPSQAFLLLDVDVKNGELLEEVDKTLSTLADDVAMQWASV